MTKEWNKTRGVTMMVLVITIVVLLILAGVSLSLVTGEKGIIQQAKEAKRQSEINAETELIELATVKAMGDDSTGKLTLEGLDSAMQVYTNKDKYTIENDNGTIKITFTESGRYYNVDEAGSVTLAGAGQGTGGSGGNTGTGGNTGDNTGGNTGGNTGTGDNTGTGGNNPSGTPGNRYETETPITVDGKPVTIPGGATLSKVPEESTIDGGLVIYIIPEGRTVDWTNSAEVEYAQKTYSQFVWVPVETPVLDLSNQAESLVTDATIRAAVELEISRGKYPMAIKNTDGNYFGVLYGFTYNTGTKTVDIGLEAYWTPLNTNYREPDVLNSSTYDAGAANLNQINGILNTSYNTSTAFKNALQEEYNTMIERIYTNKGFWVGRYETSGMSNSTTTSYAESNEIKINVVKGATVGINNTTWYRMYAHEKIYAKKAGITGTSSMIWGSQWDQIMIWMKDVDNTARNSKYIVDSIGMANFGSISGVNDGYTDTSNPAATGCFKVKNVYDLAGNISDWTLEANYTYYRVYRGYYYDFTNTAYTRADFRSYSYPTNSHSSYGSRVTLY